MVNLIKERFASADEIKLCGTAWLGFRKGQRHCKSPQGLLFCAVIDPEPVTQICCIALSADRQRRPHQSCSQDPGPPARSENLDYFFPTILEDCPSQ